MEFLKTFLASLLGVIVGAFLLFLILFAVIVSSSTETEPYIRSNSVLTMDISGDIPARSVVDPFEELMNPNLAGNRVSLETLKNNLEKAAVDDNIDLVWVKTNFVGASWANLQTAYKYFETFKESGKPLYFSTDDLGMNEKSYFLATLADSIFSPPATNFEFDGFVGQFTFYKPMLEKIGIEPEIFRVGKYKSAVEPYTNESSSPESQEQMYEIMSAASATFVSAVAKRTGKTDAEIHDMLNFPPVDRLNYALENGLIDAFAYDDQIESAIKERLNIEEDDELQTVNYGRYSRVNDKSAGLEANNASDKIAVIYSSGMILPDLADSPFTNTSGITPKTIKKQIDSALEDDDVKAIVIHINSPGGSATSSDLIWHSIKQASEEIPVIASMGSVAASGGYYMAMGADTVLAAENTITGSIGIFNLLFNAQELLNDNIGILYESHTSHEYADLFDLTRPFTTIEQQIIQQNVESGYETFLNVVAEGRNMSRDQAHERAQGRVYTGAAALEAGLVDMLGDLDDAIRVAAETAELEEYSIDTYPKSTDIFESFFGSAEAQVQTYIQGWMPKDLMEDTQSVRHLLNQPSGQNWMLLPGKFDVN